MDRAFFSQDSYEIDAFLGFKINEIEGDLLSRARILRPKGDMDSFGEVLHQGHQTWVGLDPQTLNTPYCELVEMCDLLKPKKNEVVIDLGAGYGRLGIVLFHLYPETHFIGYELVSERVHEGNNIFKKLTMKNSKLIEQDLMNSEFVIPDANYYFIYDFGKTEHIRKTLSQLELKTASQHFKVIARGKGTRSIIEHEHPWLTSLNEVIHKENFSIYSF